MRAADEFERFFGLFFPISFLFLFWRPLKTVINSILRSVSSPSLSLSISLSGPLALVCLFAAHMNEFIAHLMDFKHWPDQRYAPTSPEFSYVPRATCVSRLNWPKIHFVWILMVQIKKFFFFHFVIYLVWYWVNIDIFSFERRTEITVINFYYYSGQWSNGRRAEGSGAAHLFLFPFYFRWPAATARRLRRVRWPHYAIDNSVHKVHLKYTAFPAVARLYAILCTSS